MSGKSDKNISVEKQLWMGGGGHQIKEFRRNWPWAPTSLCTPLTIRHPAFNKGLSLFSWSRTSFPPKGESRCGTQTPSRGSHVCVCQNCPLMWAWCAGCFSNSQFLPGPGQIGLIFANFNCWSLFTVGNVHSGPPTLSPLSDKAGYSIH